MTDDSQANHSPSEPPHAQIPATGTATFPSTHWSLVLCVTTVEHPGRLAALDTLCRTYWKPLYFFARRAGSSPEDAADSTQEFLGTVLTQKLFQNIKIGAEHGKLRSFLLTAFRRFLGHQRETANSWRRGGRHEIISIDLAKIEASYHSLLTDHDTPERLYDKKWALTIMDQALRRLQTEREAAGKGPLFNALRPFLTGEPTGKDKTLAATAATLGMTDAVLRVALQRLRQRYAAVLLKVIADTIHSDNPADLEGELGELRQALAV